MTSPTDDPRGAAFSFDALRRHPDVEAPELVAVDATDRLLLDEAAPALAGAPAGSVVVVGDRYGALTLGAAALHGATALRVHQDALTGRRALAANAERTGLAGAYRNVDLDAGGLAGARVVLLQLPRSLDRLDDVAAAVAAHADPDVLVLAGGRVKHMTLGMNEVLGRYFARVEASLARQKSRVLRASGPLRPAEGADGTRGRPPATARDIDLDLVVAAHGGAFAGPAVDIGTRALLRHLDAAVAAVPAGGHALDLGCGTGVVSAVLARSRPDLRITATDDSAVAVASARATLAVNGLADRVAVVHDDGASHLPDGAVDVVLLNPPFHSGSAVHTGVAQKLFAEAARVLRPGGELWTVWNSALAYRPALERAVGPTRQVGRDPKFTVTVSTRR